MTGLPRRRRRGESATLRAVVAGGGSAAVRIFARLLDRGHEIVAVCSAARGEGPFAAALLEAGRARSVRCLPYEALRGGSGAAELKEMKPDMLLAAGLPVVVAADVLSNFKLGAYNLHTGPLPRYGGLNAVSWALYHGESGHGVTLHLMDEHVDTGPIVFQAMFALHEDESAVAVLGRCLREGVLLVDRLVEKLEGRADLPLTAQNPEHRTFFPAGPPGGGRINWRRRAREVYNLVRACDFGPYEGPWGRPWGIWEGTRVEIVAAGPSGTAAAGPPGRVVAVGDDSVLISCRDECLRVTRVRAAGEERKPGRLFRPGSSFEGW